jgi:aspartyl-tRNA(Asn)/glutamyl-tRNA(Gln) amidotransferase subunit B
VLEEMFHDETEPLDIIKKKGLKPIENKDELKKTVDTVLLENHEAVSQIRQGNTKSISFLIGQVMKKTNGRASPKETRELIDEAVRG